jgi:hypothetical protein
MPVIVLVWKPTAETLTLYVPGPSNPPLPPYTQGPRFGGEGLNVSVADPSLTMTWALQMGCIDVPSFTTTSSAPIKIVRHSTPPTQLAAVRSRATTGSQAATLADKCNAMPSVYVVDGRLRAATAPYFTGSGHGTSVA